MGLAHARPNKYSEGGGEAKPPSSCERGATAPLAPYFYTLARNTILCQFVSTNIQQWCNELKTSFIASTQPHAAYAALHMHGVSSKWTHLIRTIPSISHLL